MFVPWHLSTVREKAGIGAVGSGKTISLVADVIMFGLEQPGSRMMVCRDTVPALKETTEAELLNLISIPPPEGGKTLYDIIYENNWIRRSGGHVDKIWLPGGSEILFRSLDDWRKLMSLNLAYIGIDEANTIDLVTYENLLSRLRQQEPTAEAQRQANAAEDKDAVRRLSAVWDNPRQQMALATNPDGHDWVWQRFVNPENQHPDRRWFKSTIFDNPTFFDNGEPNEFVRHLMTMPKDWQDRFLYCKFDTFSGQIYDNFDPKQHVHEHFMPVGPDWERGMGMDWGIDNPTALGWWCRRKGTNKWYKYREWMSYDPDTPGSRERAGTVTVDYVANVIKQLEQGEEIRWRAADPMVWRRQTGDKENRTIDYWFRKNGIVFRPGAEKEGPRISTMQLLLGRDMLSVSEKCPMTIRNMQQYRWERPNTPAKMDLNNPEKAMKKNDHDLNADQYFFTLILPFTEKPDKPGKVSWDDMMWDQVRRKKYARMSSARNS